MFGRKRKRVQLNQPASDLSARVADSVQPTFSSQSAFQPLFDRGVMNFENRNYEAAIADFSVYIRVNPKNVYAYIYRGRAYLELHEMEKAYRDMAHSVRIDPNCGEGYFWWGFVEGYYQETSESLRAIKRYDKAFELGYRSAELYFRRASIKQYELHDYEGALEDYAEGFKLDPNCYWAYSRRSNLYLKLKNREAAWADEKKAIELQPEDSYFRIIGRAQTSYEQGDFDQVIADCDFLIRERRRQSVPYYLRGMVRRERGDFEGALEDFQRTLRYTSLGSDTHQLRTLITEMKSKIYAAKDKWRTTPKKY